MEHDYEKQLLECNDKFENIFKLTSAASKIIAADLTILRVNKAVTELLGYRAEEIEGTRILDYACPEYKQHWHELQKAMWQDGKPFFNLETCLFRKDKSIAWVNVTTVLFHEQDESYAFTVLDDITWRKNYEESEKRLNLALHYSKMGIWEMSLENYNVIRSDTHDKLFGYKNQQENWTIENYLNHLLPEDIAPFQESIKAVTTGASLNFKGRIKTLGQTIIWVQLEGKAEFNAEGKPVKLLGTIKDITTEKTAEKYKDEFISTISHELKTPITSIKAQVQILERKFVTTSDVTVALMLKRISLQINRLNILIRDLLDIGRTDEHALQLHKDEFLFNKMVEDTVTEIQRTTNTHNLIIKNTEPVICFGDRGRMSQLLSNLLTNSIKYSPGKDKVFISFQEQHDQIVCSIQDFGIGILREKQIHIFERFYRAAGIQNNVISGLGLGLYISAELIKRLKGAIWLKSVPGEGSTFYFSVPKTM